MGSMGKFTPILQGTTEITGILDDATRSPWSVIGAYIHLLSTSVLMLSHGFCGEGLAAWQNVGLIIFIIEGVLISLMVVRPVTRFWTLASGIPFALTFIIPLGVPVLVVSLFHDRTGCWFFSAFLPAVVPVHLVVAFAGYARIAQVPLLGPPFVRYAFGKPVRVTQDMPLRGAPAAVVGTPLIFDVDTSPEHRSTTDTQRSITTQQLLHKYKLTTAIVTNTSGNSTDSSRDFCTDSHPFDKATISL